MGGQVHSTSCGRVGVILSGWTGTEYVLCLCRRNHVILGVVPAHPVYHWVAPSTLCTVHMYVQCICMYSTCVPVSHVQYIQHVCTCVLCTVCTVHVSYVQYVQHMCTRVPCTAHIYLCIPVSHVQHICTYLCFVCSPLLAFSWLDGTETQK